MPRLWAAAGIIQSADSCAAAVVGKMAAAMAMIEARIFEENMVTSAQPMRKDRAIVLVDAGLENITTSTSAVLWG